MSTVLFIVYDNDNEKVVVFLDKEIANAVVTGQAKQDAGKISSMKVQCIINNPTGTTITYGIDKSGGESSRLVFDLGGGTFDSTLLKIDQGVFEILVTNRDTHLSEEDEKQRVMQFFIKMMKKNSNVESALLIRYEEANSVKRELSSQI